MVKVKESAAITFAAGCRVKECDRDGRFLFSGHCAYHEAMLSARELSPEDFDALRAELSTTAPVSSEERRQRSVRNALRDIEWKARDLKRGKRQARKSGATEGQIADAVKRGKAVAE